ncbi:hypothetical protein LEP1GSC131_3107 [Leptospira kirschneri str. 200802841]|uniref:Uncharacterized protein n=1 Tax=Leptospira kirschneri str. 200802841 TaxID=1193047 RepID=A0A828Y893_9LEPT|nr:hypothetical protein LEP1GSC131_3107 [Leptospira kirschneri str. 200802841]
MFLLCNAYYIEHNIEIKNRYKLLFYNSILFTSAFEVNCRTLLSEDVLQI